MLELSIMPELSYNGGPSLAPQENDLQRLYQLLIERRATTVLEFGCGYSSWVIQEALKENKAWFADKDVQIRNPHLFQGFSVDTNRDWVKDCRAKIPDITFSVSPCQVDLFNTQLCHMYLKIPDIVPDFIYLDGPDPKQVTGDMNNLTFEHRTPMASDILLMEPTLIPGTAVLVDGRTNNVRFLRKNLRRTWWFQEEDDTALMILDESKLGYVNAVGRDILGS